jgi:hypothetical protein
MQLPASPIHFDDFVAVADGRSPERHPGDGSPTPGFMSHGAISISLPGFD